MIIKRAHATILLSSYPVFIYSFQQQQATSEDLIYYSSVLSIIFTDKR